MSGEKKFLMKNQTLSITKHWIAHLASALVGVVVTFLVINNFAKNKIAGADWQARNADPAQSGGNKRILLWTSFWKNYSDRWEKIFYRLLSRQCPVNACEFVYDQRLLNTSDAVLFHPIDFLSETPLPEFHDPNQPWIFFTLEAPPVAEMFPVDYDRLKGIINWTMTYRRDSDIFVPYGRVVPRRSNTSPEFQIEPPIPNPGEDSDKEDIEDPWSQKSENRMAAWMVSHCHTDGRREWFVKELVKYMPVHVFGRCGHMTCGKHISVRTLGTFDQEPCNREIDQYFFYLSFENAICEDYVTEKFFMALQRNVVPVVFGGADYEAFAPPRSYINALEFGSPKELAEALQTIARNRTIYNKFFEWKKHYTVELGHPFLPMVCDLCTKLHRTPYNEHPQPLHSLAAPPGLNPRVLGKDKGFYPDVGAWYVTGSSCRRWWLDEKDYKRYSDHRKTPYRDPVVKVEGES